MQWQQLVLTVAAAAAAAPVRLVVDTDLGFDVDDAGALAVASHLADLGECELVGVVHDTGPAGPRGKPSRRSVDAPRRVGFVKGVGGADTIVHYYGRDPPLGAYTGPWGSSDDAQQAQDKCSCPRRNRVAWP